MTSTTIEMIGKGQITIPKKIRESNGHKEGTKFEILTIGNAYLIEPVDDAESPIREIESAFLGISRNLASQGVSLEDMLAELRRIRENE
jgi:AbrB family looped-hinge helix DNA binding protein